MRTDESFRREIEALDHDRESRREERYARLRETVRKDLPIEVVAQFLA